MFDDLLGSRREPLNDIKKEIEEFVSSYSYDILDDETYDMLEDGLRAYLDEHVKSGNLSSYQIKRSKKTIFKILLVR